MKKTALEHFQDIKELEVADGPGITVEDLLPGKCEKVWKSLKALEIIKEKNVDVKLLKLSTNLLDYYTMVKHKTGYNTELTEEEFNLLKEVLE